MRISVSLPLGLSGTDYFLLRRFSTVLDYVSVNSASAKPIFSGNLGTRNWKPIPVPHRKMPEPKGQDLDFVNVAHSHLIHSDWDKLSELSAYLTPSRVNHILVKIQKDHVLSLEFFNWVKTQNPSFQSLETLSIMLHILTKNRKFKSAESILRITFVTGQLDLPAKLLDAILYSYRLCDSSPRVFDSLFKFYAHKKKFRHATDTFSQMKIFGFLPTVESCNAYISSLLDLHRVDIALLFYREMKRCRISPNVYTLNMVMDAYCKSGKLDKALEVFGDMERLGFSPTVPSYNTLIAGHCNKGLLGLAMKLKNSMGNNGLQPNVVTYNTLIHGFCKEGKLNEASKVFSEMKAINVSPNTITYNTLINGFSQVGYCEMASRLYDEMASNGVKADILTYNALILGLCREGKTKKAAYLVRELDKENLVPNASTFSALISGQCVRKNPDRAFQLYKSMTRSGCYPNDHILNMMVSAFCKNEDFVGAVEVLGEILDRSITPDSVILSELYNGLKQSGKDQLAMKLHREMEAKHLLPEGLNGLKTIYSGDENKIKQFKMSHEDFMPVME
ncbi:LOW QUALITY PROTEIN: pentatricopeptide repeat-containing protein At4g26680, mitochondrial-like [Carica papaya]|uniref:LOW QUALITY PROTEIN: pentatricopeptide repeat-containing protein At4g26680, mitochondrial-like n=1 Tax=Carica papaya TaxID=3649 RepID=UPI000B8C98D9|nr:LOW QUALITY PROTEIN: pentatricopeptide repeat-containing protein At4g26680, mitochondrial-like [Carica papaya]